MSILISDEIKKCIYKELQSCHQSIVVITAFCKQNALEFMQKNCNETIKDKTLIVRFQLKDIINGATDLQIYEYCKSHEWKMYAYFDLHAKMYIFDDKNGVIGSANLTNKGILLEEGGNLEMAEKCEVDETDIQRVNCLIKGSVEMDDRIYSIMKAEALDKMKNRTSSELGWSKRITDLFRPVENMLFVNDFSEYDTAKESLGQKIEFLEMSKGESLTEIQQAFSLCRAYRWLLELLQKHGGEMYFGEITVELHSALVNDPKPYRKDVKVLLARLLEWTQELECKEVIVDRPRHSQRVRLSQKVN